MLYGVINSQGLSISYEPFMIKCGGRMNMRKILKSLTVVEKPGFGKPKGAPLIIKYAYIHQKNTIIFPRNKAEIFIKHNLIDDIKIEYTITPRIIQKYEICIPLYDYQEQIITYLLKYRYSNKNGICYLQMDTGLGKSRLGCALINELGFAALIVVPTIAIGYQWIDECKELYPDMTTLFYHNGKKYNTLKYDIVIVVVNTFCKKDTSFLDGFGIIIFDEAHEYYTTCNGKVLWLAQTRVILGLSATPLERPDELDRYVTLHLGKPLYANEIVDITSVNFKGRVKCINYYGDPKHTETVLTEKGTSSSILTIGNIIKDTSRIELIVKEVKRLYNDKYGIFVFAEHRDFLDILKGYLLDISEDDITIEDGSEISILRGGVTKTDLNTAKEKGAHIVLTTYGYSRRGISLTEMTAIIMTSPRRNGIKQIIGRILRRGSDESIVREIVDIVDVRSNLKSQYFDRKKIYDHKKYPITTVRADYVNIEEECEVDSCSDVSDYSITKIQNILENIYGLSD